MKALFLIPSFYGLLTFVVAFALYWLNLIGYVHTASDSYLLCLYAIVCFACSTLFSLSSYARLTERESWKRPQTESAAAGSIWVYFAMHLLGLFGIYKYVMALVGYFGSPAELLATFASESYKIRQASDEVQNLGTQLSYFGWIAIWMTAYRAGRTAVSRWLWVLVLVQFVANLIYIDRTRPVWILFCGALLFGIARYEQISVARLVRAAATGAVILVAVFVGVGAWIGKISLESGHASAHSVLPVGAEPIYLYATSGFAYLDQVVAEEHPDYGIPRRLLYPAMAVLSKLDVAERPPAQINDFRNVPMPTNVGTFLEPMYRDSGAAGVLLGVLVLSFGGNALARFLLSRRTAITLVAWATLCFGDFIGFFTPKMSSTPTWLIVIVGVIGALISGVSRDTGGPAIDMESVT